ncbi:hypothetical protein [Acinetobacter indicus]|uniref:hypothetical protein n=1 Tax=Acinetobacter indicus TaxID=756892 RepID=UPI000CEB76DD|nr:hypothetical protein [Acinetobacter indicus]AVH15583.1 hypothetical protein CTZ23_08245 [Acinetobacter indicus]
MVQLIKKGGLRERANRSRRFHGSENTETTLAPNRYSSAHKKAETAVSALVNEQDQPCSESEHTDGVIAQPQGKNQE